MSAGEIARLLNISRGAVGHNVTTYRKSAGVHREILNIHSPIEITVDFAFQPETKCHRQTVLKKWADGKQYMAGQVR